MDMLDIVTQQVATACGLLRQPGAVQEAQKLTILYGGMVVVLDGCTPEKATMLVRLAAGGEAVVPALVDDKPVRARHASLRRFLSKRKATTAPAPAPAPEPVPYERNDEEPEPAAKKGKADQVSREDIASWLALSLGPMHAL